VSFSGCSKFDDGGDQADELSGSSGSGKTSVQQLISRFYDPTGGSVEFDTDGKLVAISPLEIS
jgi:ABC-type polysaccharide/polyol phosphate transport system ATPase subunit